MKGKTNIIKKLPPMLLCWEAAPWEKDKKSLQSRLFRPI